MALRKSFYFFNGQRVIYEQKHHNGLQKEKQKDKKKKGHNGNNPQGGRNGNVFTATSRSSPFSDELYEKL